MTKEKKILKSASIVAGALLTTALVASPLSGMDILAYNDLGSGAEVRSQLIDMNSNQINSSDATTYKVGELKCGEDGKKETKSAKGEKANKADVKSADSKKAAAASTTKADAKKADVKEEKSKEAKCGEGKCGEGKCGA